MIVRMLRGVNPCPITFPVLLHPHHANATSLIVNEYAACRKRFAGFRWLSIVPTMPTHLIS